MQTTQRTLFAAALAFAPMVVTPPALACNGRGNCANATVVKGAPGPIAGAGLAGLPILAIGYGVYWLVKRRHKWPVSMRGVAVNRKPHSDVAPA